MASAHHHTGFSILALQLPGTGILTHAWHCGVTCTLPLCQGRVLCLHAESMQLPWMLFQKTPMEAAATGPPSVAYILEGTAMQDQTCLALLPAFIKCYHHPE